MTVSLKLFEKFANLNGLLQIDKLGVEHFVDGVVCAERLDSFSHSVVEQYLVFFLFFFYKPSHSPLLLGSIKQTRGDQRSNGLNLLYINSKGLHQTTHGLLF